MGNVVTKIITSLPIPIFPILTPVTTPVATPVTTPVVASPYSPISKYGISMPHGTTPKTPSPSNPLGSLIFNLIFGVLTLTNTLTSTSQNGLSLLGTISAPNLPNFLGGSPLAFGYPWGSLTAAGSVCLPYTTTPNTGVTRVYDFTVTRGVIAPDGVQKNVILVNGQFPGPTIEANWGDMIMVTVHNKISQPEEGIGFHWHGLLQKKSQWYDGVPAVSQCPIAPGDTFVYNFQADMYGTTWYHSHYSAQYAGGLIGPLVIYGPKSAPYDVDLGPVMLTDYYHRDYFSVLQGVMTSSFSPNFNPALSFPSSDNNLINGKMNFNCSSVPAGTKCTPNAGLAKFKFTRGMTHRLRLINAGAEGVQRFSVDGYSMSVIANDFVPIKPYTTNVVTLGIGQRTDVLITIPWTAPPGTFWIRSNITSCSIATQPFALAVGYINDLYVNTDVAPKSKPWNVPDPGTCANDALSLTQPLYPIASIPKPATITQVDINFVVNATGFLVWTMNGQPFRANYNSPILLMVNQGSMAFEKEWNVYNFGTNSSITFVINNPVGLPAHPIHMHGHNFFVLNEGIGTWDGTVVNPQNPQRRDVQLLQPGGYIALQIQTDNPGVWPLHCHIAWHVSAGLYINILERPDLIQKLSVPQTLAQSCRNWGTWTNTNIPDQIDSGL